MAHRSGGVPRFEIWESNKSHSNDDDDEADDDRWMVLMVWRERQMEQAGWMFL
jgi:hypothetical protein